MINRIVCIQHNFKHCSVIDIDANMWINPRYDSVEIVPVDIDSLKKANHLIAVQNCRTYYNHPLPSLFIPTCVAFVKYMIGLRCWHVMTVRQLYCLLISDNIKLFNKYHLKVCNGNK